MGAVAAGDCFCAAAVLPCEVGLVEPEAMAQETQNALRAWAAAAIAAAKMVALALALRASVAYSCGHVALRLRHVLVVLCLHSGILGRAAAVVNSALTQCFAYRPRCLVRQHTRLGQHDVQLAGAPWKQQAPH